MRRNLGEFVPDYKPQPTGTQFVPDYEPQPTGTQFVPDYKPQPTGTQFVPDYKPQPTGTQFSCSCENLLVLVHVRFRGPLSSGL